MSVCLCVRKQIRPNEFIFPLLCKYEKGLGHHCFIKKKGRNEHKIEKGIENYNSVRVGRVDLERSDGKDERGGSKPRLRERKV